MKRRRDEVETCAVKRDEDTYILTSLIEGATARGEARM